MYGSWNINHIILLVLVFPKCCLLFNAVKCQYYYIIGDIKIQILIFLNKTKILLFLGNIESIKKSKAHFGNAKTRSILWLSKILLLKLGWQKIAVNSKIKDDVQVVLLLSCFVGHPVYKILIWTWTWSYKAELEYESKSEFSHWTIV